MPATLSGKADSPTADLTRAHIESCRPCWSIWNELRWQVSENTRDFAELKEYLGEDFQYGIDSSWLLADEWNKRYRESVKDVEDFYRTTEWYIYNQVIFAASGQRPDYARAGIARMRQVGVESVLDFGCGVGTDGLELASAGINVVFHDINSRNLEFLKWRIEKRQLKNTTVEPDKPSHHHCEALWLMDVVEHMPAPEETIEGLLTGVREVYVDTHSSTVAGGRHPFHYPESMRRASNLLQRYGFKSTSIKNMQVWTRQASDQNE